MALRYMYYIIEGLPSDLPDTDGPASAHGLANAGRSGCLSAPAAMTPARATHCTAPEPLFSGAGVGEGDVDGDGEGAELRGAPAHCSLIASRRS